MESADLLDHFRLEASIFSDYTVHPSYQFHRRESRQIEKREERWNQGKTIGYGLCSQVFLETRVVEGERASEEPSLKRAVKRIDKGRMDARKIDYRRELLALAKLSKYECNQQQVFVEFQGWFEDTKTVYIAMEYIALGDLGSHIAGLLSETDILQIAHDVVLGLKIMHCHGFTHRDLKPGNIFVVQKSPEAPFWWVKIGDFGISKRVRNEEETRLITNIGTPLYQAPEVQGFSTDSDLDQGVHTYTNAVDMWSLGCVLFKLATGSVPFPVLWRLGEYCSGRETLPTEKLSQRLEANGVEFIASLLRPTPSERPNAEDAMSHVWFENHITAANIMHSDSSESPNVHIRIDEVFPEGNQRKRGPGILRDAVRQDSTDIVAALLSRSFKLDSRLDDGRNVLHIAAMLGYPHVVKEVFKKDRSLGLDLLKQPGGDWDDRPIHSAAYSEHVDVIDTLSELGADLEARQRTLETALHIACEHGRPKAVYKLLSLGADPNALEMSSMTPLHLAAQNGHVAIIKHLLEFNKGGRDYLEQRCKPKGDAALHKAARCNYKFKPSYVPYSPIPYSDCDSTYLECFRVINKAGAAIDATNDLGETPLHIAASTGNVGIINFILSHLPEPKISVALSQTTLGWKRTPLHEAITEGHLLAVNRLLSAGSDLSQKTGDGLSALQLAEKCYEEDIVMLIKHSSRYAGGVDGRPVTGTRIGLWKRLTGPLIV